MGWADDVERRRQRAQPQQQQEEVDTEQAASRAKQRSSRRREEQSSGRALFITVAAAAVLVPLAHRFGWIDAAQDALEDALGVTFPWRKGGSSPGSKSRRGADSGGGRSAFKFPAVKPNHSGAAAPTSSAPKGNAKKLSRDARQQRNAERAAKRDGAGTLVPGGVGTLPEGRNVVAGAVKNDDVVGGDEGVTLVTNSRYITSAMDKRVHEEARAAKALLK